MSHPNLFIKDILIKSPYFWTFVSVQRYKLSQYYMNRSLFGEPL